MGLLGPGVYLWGHRFIFGSLEALITSWSYLGGLTAGSSFAELKSSSENLADVQKHCR